MILVDTHVAIWITTQNSALGKLSHSLLDQAFRDNRVCISAISFWELGILIAKRRLDAITSPSEHRAKILGSGFQEIAVTGDIAILAAGLDLHADPANRFIVATAITHDATLMTADRALLRWRHKLPRQNAAK